MMIAVEQYEGSTRKFDQFAYVIMFEDGDRGKDLHRLLDAFDEIGVKWRDEDLPEEYQEEEQHVEGNETI